MKHNNRRAIVMALLNVVLVTVAIFVLMYLQR